LKRKSPSTLCEKRKASRGAPATQLRMASTLRRFSARYSA
jgi:hypothetical protein